MLLVNQANDHGEIIGSGVADAIVSNAEDRIEVIADWKSGVDIQRMDPHGVAKFARYYLPIVSFEIG
jgi:hypothetical protein